MSNKPIPTRERTLSLCTETDFAFHKRKITTNQTLELNFALLNMQFPLVYKGGFRGVVCYKSKLSIKCTG